MKSMIDLTLKGHFEHLKEQANAQSISLSDRPLISKVIDYLEKLNDAKKLDEEGIVLLKELLGVGAKAEFDLPDLKPMKRADSSQTKPQISKNKKAG